MTEPTVTPANAGRLQGGRFVPWVSGNPAGKKAGTRHRVTLLAEKLLADDAEAVVKAVIAEDENTPNELLEEKPHERLDTRTPGAASGADPQLATVGGGDGPEDCRKVRPRPAGGDQLEPAAGPLYR